MGGYLEYPEYKDSGVEWLGKIPTHWIVSKAKFVSNVFVPQRNKPDLNTDEGIPWLTMDDMTSERILTTSFKVHPEAAIQAGSKTLTKGAVIASCVGNFGVAAINDVDVIINQQLQAFIPTSIHTEYLCLFIRVSSEYFKMRATAATVGYVNQSGFANMPIVLPPIDEQQTIARFLDYKTAQIDALIAKKESLLAKLAEKRTALISQAVTKGLDPTVPMKDSGIEWLGDIPAHWEIMVLKRLAEVRGGVTKGRKLDNVETLELPYLRVANVQDGHIDTADMSNIEITLDEVERYSLKAGDVLMNEGGDNDKLGRGAVWDARIDPCLHQNHVFAVRPYEKVLSNWLALITSSSYAKFYFFSKAKQTTNLASISATNIKLLPVVLPPESERNQILQFLETQNVENDQAVEKISEVVNRLKEYRTALITNAVTGKIDVRDVKLPEADWLKAS